MGYWIRLDDLGGQLIARLTSERGTTLVETAIATGILLVVMAGLLGMAALATQYTENHGHLEARTTEYAQDKMEQLLALAYGDTIANSVLTATTLVTQQSGGSGIAVGGGVDTAAPVNTYVDWLQVDGTPLGGGATPPANWFYQRVWKVECVAASCTNSPPTGLKQITITATVRSSVGHALIPKSTVVALKASEF